MNPATAARVLAALGWLAGMALVLDGCLIAGLAVLCLAMAAAVTSRWWVAWLQGQWLAVRLRWTMRRIRSMTPEKTGSAVERA